VQPCCTRVRVPMRSTKAEQPVVRKRPLGIPTVADRIAQTVVKYGSKHPEKDSRR
jgi:retron-type reverse transcriptase